MKKPLILSILLFVFLNHLFAQEPFDHLMTKRYLNCTDIGYNCSFLIPEFYERNSYDSLHQLLNYWETRC